MTKRAAKNSRTKLLPKHHTGKLRPHKHTSYGGLTLILFLTVVALIGVSNSVVSAAAEDPVTDTYKTYAVVEGPVPKNPPVITSPVTGRNVSTSEPIAVRGTCPSNTLVKVFKNEVLAASALCQNGTFQTSIDLFVGNNSLIARAFNTNDAASPDSTPVSVLLQLPGVKTTGTEQLNTSGAPAGQSYITAETTHRGFAVGETASWPVILDGGQAPYAVSVSWGDGKTDLYSRTASGRFDISHAYDKPGGYRGSYTIVIKSTDQAGSKSYMQLVAIVSSDKPAAGVVGSIKGGYNKSVPVKTAWQLTGVIAIVIASFWLGERRQTRVLKRRTA